MELEAAQEAAELEQEKANELTVSSGHAKSAEVGQLIISLLTTGSVLGMHLVIMI